MNGDLDQLIALVRDAQSIAVLTGAGVSAESGIPTFRDALTGFWSRYDPEELATPDAFRRNPALVTRWYDERRLRCAECQPNPAHRALATLQQRSNDLGRSFFLITQNVDRLHQLAGSKNVVELHGTLFEWRCTETGQQREYCGGPFPEYPPRSERGGPLRPAVVWFGEPLPPNAVQAADRAVTDCDLFLSIGTSAVVYPAAGYIHLARSHGARTAEINRDPTPISSIVDVSVRGLAGEILPTICAALSSA